VLRPNPHRGGFSPSGKGLILIGTYYWYTAYEIQVVKHEIKKPVTNEVKMCTLSNYYNGIIETRVINVISDGGELYFYSHKNSKHVEQLKDNNRVTLLMYTKDGNIFINKYLLMVIVKNINN
jgi:general stress protein 26